MHIFFLVTVSHDKFANYFFYFFKFSPTYLWVDEITDSHCIFTLYNSWSIKIVTREICKQLYPDLHCLPFSLWIFNMINLTKNLLEICRHKFCRPLLWHFMVLNICYLQLSCVLWKSGQDLQFGQSVNGCSRLQNGETPVSWKDLSWLTYRHLSEHSLKI